MHIYLFDFDNLKLYLFKKIISYRDELPSIVSFCYIYPTTMARNKGGGSKHKKGKNTQQVETLLLRSENAADNEFYAHVIKPYGNGQFGVHLVVSDGDKLLSLTEKEYRGRLSGRMRKQKRRNFVNKDDFVLMLPDITAGPRAEIDKRRGIHSRRIWQGENTNARTRRRCKQLRPATPPSARSLGTSLVDTN